MASPQAENGHIDIANELAEALCRTNLSAYESRILWFIFRKTYGWHKKSDHISYTQFEEGTGIARRHVARTLKRLEARNIMTISGSGRRLKYSFQKDYHLWLDLPNSHTNVTDGGNDKPNRCLKGAKSLPKGVTTSLPKGVNTKEKKETKQKKEVSPSENKQTREAFAALQERRDWNTSKHAAEAKAIRWMLGEGYTTSEILDCHDHMKAQPFWKDKSLYMMSIQGQIGEWRKGLSQQGQEWKVR